MSINMAGLSLGGMIMVPVASYLVVTRGFETTIIALAVINSLVGSVNLRYSHY